MHLIHRDSRLHFRQCPPEQRAHAERQSFSEQNNH